jgi:hypothetical protein
MALDLRTNPLHFETWPVDAPENAEMVAPGMLVAWTASRVGLSPALQAHPLYPELVARTITGPQFLARAMDGTFTSDHVAQNDDALAFLNKYTKRMFLLGSEARKPTSTILREILRLHRDDERAFADDYLGTFRNAVPTAFHVPDSWAAFDRFAHVLDARWKDFLATKMKAEPDLDLYRQAAVARDAIAITPARKATAPVKLDPRLTDDMLGLLGKPLTDKEVKATLKRVGLPIGRIIDEQALQTLGLSYMGSKFALDGKRVLGVADVGFWAEGQEAHIRGLGARIAFAGYPNPLPHGLAWGMPRAEVTALLGPPTRTDPEIDRWTHATYVELCWFDSDGRLVRFKRSLPPQP